MNEQSKDLYDVLLNGATGSFWWNEMTIEQAGAFLATPGMLGELLDQARKSGIDARRWEQTVRKAWSARNGEAPRGKMNRIRADTIEKREVEWLWQPYLAIGSIALIDGDPGQGKSLLTLQLAANVSRGYPFPDQLGVPTIDHHEPANVLLMAKEDSLEETVRPRLDACGADVSRIYVETDWLDHEGQEQSFTFKHLDILEPELDELRPRLVILDPIQSYFGDIDMHRANETRPLLEKLGSLARRYRCLIVCVRHVAKPGQGFGKALHRGLGSTDVIGAARTALFVEQYPGKRDLALLCESKSNLGPIGVTHIFSKAQGEFSWHSVTRLTTELIGGSGHGPAHEALIGAYLWLEKRLEGGLLWPVKDIQDEADQEGISKETLKNARQALRPRSVKLSKEQNAPWGWKLDPMPAINLLPIERTAGTAPETAHDTSPTTSTRHLRSTTQSSQTTPTTPSLHKTNTYGYQGVVGVDSEQGVEGRRCLVGEEVDKQNNDFCHECRCTDLLRIGNILKCAMCGHSWQQKEEA